MSTRTEEALDGHVLRYIVNGLLATAIQYAVLRCGLEILHMPSAGVANGVASVFGITASFLGNRYFVFRAADGHLGRQGATFLASYAVIAILNTGVLYLWTDVNHLNYTAGFLLATGLQVVSSYAANRMMVFS